MVLLIDTNIVLDVLLNRPEFVKDSSMIWKLCETEQAKGYISTSESMAETMQDNLNGQLTILKSQLEELAISFGDILMPTIRKIVSAVQQFVDKLNSILNRFHQITADCNYKVAAFAAELVEPHHGICDKFALGVANSQHLLRVKVLNVVNVLGVFHPFAPDAQQAARCQVLDNFFHK